MDLCITFCRAIAAMVITNAHYQHIYPWPCLASGGLLGDVIFFAVSGYCIHNLKSPFAKWYQYRLLRIYPAVWGSSFVFALVGFYDIQGFKDLAGIFLYPTSYHFVASIVVLYAIYYAFFSLDITRKHVLLSMVVIIALFMVYYVLDYDKSTYRIDNVRMWEIRVLFFEAMLFGAYARQNRDRWINQTQRWHIPAAGALCLVYILSKWAFSRYNALVAYQVLNWIALFAAMSAFIRLMFGLEDSLARLPRPVLSLFTFVATITLEIYLVQYELIPRMEGVFAFPLNFAFVTVAIGASAYVLHIFTSRSDNIVVKVMAWQRSRGL
jgi:hypothetical protein